MSRSIENIYVNPLFYDVLSGEFNPPTDPAKRAHTLGRLALATFSKGEWTPPAIGGSRAKFTYEPSWAPQALVEVTASRLPKTQDTPEIVSLSLLAPEQPDNDTFFYTVGGPDNGTHVAISRLQRMESTILPLELGPGLAQGRELATQVAQEFFDSLQA